jgi:hypothetical protein
MSIKEEKISLKCHNIYIFKNFLTKEETYLKAVIKEKLDFFIFFTNTLFG